MAFPVTEEHEKNIEMSVGTDEVESTITLSTEDDGAESSINMSVDDNEAESDIHMDVNGKETESNLIQSEDTNYKDSKPHKVDKFGDIEVENDATIGGTLRAHKIVVPLGDKPAKGGKDIYSSGAAYEYSASYLEVDDTLKEQGIVGLTIVNADGKALGRKVYVDSGASDIVLKAVKELRKISQGDAQNITNAAIDLLKIYIDKEIKNVALKFISKEHPDTAHELITFLKGLIIGDGHGINAAGEAILKAITSKNFNPSEQSGFGITQRADGKYQLSITDLIVWGKAIFNELELRRLSYVGGNFVFSSCGSKIKKIEDKGNVWRCYFYQDDGSTATTNLWEIDDQARCQTFNIKAGVYAGVTNRSYWRRVMAKGEDYIDLSKTDCEQGSDAPMAEDTLVQFGNRTDTRRQAIIEIRTVGEGVPAIIMYYGVNSYTLEGKITSIQSPGDVAMAADRFRLISRSGVKVPLVANRGTWATGEKYGYYDQVSHDGRLWLCVAPAGTVVTSRPSTTNSQWQLQVDKGSDGASAITMTIESDKGSILYNGQGAIKLTAHIYEGNTEITSTIAASKFSWQRVSSDTTGDTVFNNTHKSVGNSITITKADVMQANVKFECIYNN